QAAAGSRRRYGTPAPQSHPARRRPGRRPAAADLHRQPDRPHFLRDHPAQGQRRLRRRQFQGAVRIHRTGPDPSGRAADLNPAATEAAGHSTAGVPSYNAGMRRAQRRGPFPEPVSMLHYLNTIRLRSTRMFLTITRIMLPVMVIVYVADRLGLVRLAGEALTPAMALLGLPPEAGIIWATTALTNIYGGMASMAALSDGLQMTTAQVSALGAMMLFAPTIPTEQSVVRRACARALVYGAAVCWICRVLDVLQDPVSLAWMRQDAGLTQGPPDVWSWALSTVQSLALVLAIIVGLVVLLDVLERLGITRLVTRMLTPVLRLSGLEERAAPLTTVGVLLGLAYGGALIIEAAERENYSPRTRLLALSWLSLCHALIEDTLLILALGADVWVILVLRGLATLGVLAALAALTRPGTAWGRRLAASAQ